MSIMSLYRGITESYLFSLINYSFRAIPANAAAKMYLVLSLVSQISHPSLQMPNPTALAILGGSLVLFLDVSHRGVRLQAPCEWTLDSFFRLI